MITHFFCPSVHWAIQAQYFKAFLCQLAQLQFIYYMKMLRTKMATTLTFDFNDYND